MPHSLPQEEAASPLWGPQGVQRGWAGGRDEWGIPGGRACLWSLGATGSMGVGSRGGAGVGRVRASLPGLGLSSQPGELRFCTGANLEKSGKQGFRLHCRQPPFQMEIARYDPMKTISTHGASPTEELPREARAHPTPPGSEGGRELWPCWGPTSLKDGEKGCRSYSQGSGRRSDPPRSSSAAGQSRVGPRPSSL